MSETANNLLLEIRMLGSLLSFSDDQRNFPYAARILAFLNDEDFVNTDNKTIFATIKEIVESGAVATDMALLAALPTKPGFGGKDGMMKIDEFLDNAKHASPLTVEKTAKTLRELRLRRDFERGVKLVRHGLSHTDTSVKAELSHHVLPLLNTPSELDGDNAVRDAESVVEMLNANQSADKPVSTGFANLDDLLKGGLKREWLAVIGARPSVGKTTFAVNIINHVLLRKRGTILFFTLEMSPEEIAEKLLSMRAQAATDKNGHLTPTHAVRREEEKLRKEPLLMCPSVKNIRDLVEKATRTHEQSPLCLIVVDYLQFIPQADPRASRFVAVTEISLALKSLAKQTGVPVLALSQLSRPVSAQEESRPTLKDLRESGQIEQDANVAILLSRDSRQSEDDARISGRRKIFVDVAKNRHGSIGSFTTELLGATSTFIEI